jgi:hypothetical protein
MRPYEPFYKHVVASHFHFEFSIGDIPRENKIHKLAENTNGETLIYECNLHVASYSQIKVNQFLLIYTKCQRTLTSTLLICASSPDWFQKASKHIYLQACSFEYQKNFFFT